MSVINNLTQPQLHEIYRRLKTLENATPMNNGAVGRSGFEVYDGGTINISSGNLIGAGTFSWTGSFTQSGTTTFSGATTIAGPTGITGQLTIQGATSVTGPFTVTGATKLNGVTDVGGAFTVTGVTKLGGNTTVSGTLDVTGAMATKGTLSVEGVTTLKNDLNVTTGKIKVGALTIEPAGGGQLNFTGGAISRGAFGMLINDASRVELAAPEVKLSGPVTVTGAGTVNGNATFSTNIIAANLPPTTSAANLWVQSNGWIYKSSSASRFKIDPMTMDLPEALLEFPVKSWIDLGNAAAYADLYAAPHPRTQLQSQIMDGINLARVPGIVAEEVEAAGGEAFVTYDMDGTIEGVAYDRLALARTAILADQMRALQNYVGMT